jgi:hypothetical protein
LNKFAVKNDNVASLNLIQKGGAVEQTVEGAVTFDRRMTHKQRIVVQGQKRVEIIDSSGSKSATDQSRTVFKNVQSRSECVGA